MLRNTVKLYRVVSRSARSIQPQCKQVQSIFHKNSSKISDVIKVSYAVFELPDPTKLIINY